MKAASHTIDGRELNERLATSGLRFTARRQHVYEVLASRRNHPTAEEVFIRAKQRMPDISMATVYNCLDALVRCGVARRVRLDGGPTRYCSNRQTHGHFYCDVCRSVRDFDLTAESLPTHLNLPKGYLARHLQLSVHGTCADCARGRKSVKCRLDGRGFYRFNEET